MSISGLHFHLRKYRDVFKDMMKSKYIELIDNLQRRNLKRVSDNYCEWYALLSIEEANDIMKYYFDFELLDKKFVWHYEG